MPAPFRCQACYGPQIAQGKRPECAISPLRACFTAPHYPLSERARASTAAGLTSRSGPLLRPTVPLETRSRPGTKFVSLGDKFKICLRGRQNLSPWETKFVSLGDNAHYSKNPFRFHKESCCYAARARAPSLSRRYHDEPLAWVRAYADASTEQALQVTINALTYVCFYSHFTNVSTIAYSALRHKRPMPLQVFVSTSLQKFNLRLPTPQYSIASLCLYFATC